MILVTGSTGKLGRLVLERLLEKVPASQVIAGVRTPEKAADLVQRGLETRAVDYNRPETLEAAFHGVDQLLLISSSDMGMRVQQHRAVIDAAKSAGVGLLAYTSMLHGEKSKMAITAEHQATERAIYDSDLPFVLLRNGWYTENYSETMGAALGSGVMLGAAGEGRVAPAARADYAEAAAVVLTTKGHEGKAYELAGDQAYTLAEIAAEISRLSGKAVAYQNMTESEYSASLQSFGVPKPFADLLADADTGIARGDLNDASGDLRRLIGRPTTPISETIATTLRATSL